MMKLERIVVLQELKRDGSSISAIARRTGMDRKTVRKLLDRRAIVYGRPFATRVIFLSSSKRRVKRCRVSGLFDAATFVPLACMEMRGPGPYRICAL